MPPVAGGLAQWSFDALCSAIYNLGEQPLTPGHSLYIAVQSKPRLPWPLNVLALRSWRGRVRYALDLYVNAGGHQLAGLVRRRNAEGIEGFAPDGKPHYTVATGNPYANA
jgi:GH24 family phage-related lysozyme (muramidase)